jgi:hypothetical protein
MKQQKADQSQHGDHLYDHTMGTDDEEWETIDVTNVRDNHFSERNKQCDML